MKHTILVGLLFVVAIDPALSQDSKFLLVGPSIGINRTWGTYARPAPNSPPNSANGVEAGLNVFYKSKGKFGLLGDLRFLQTKSSMTSNDYFSSTKLELDESSKWLTVGNNLLFFPMPENRALPFFGIGLSMARLAKSQLYASMTHVNNPDEQATANRNLDEFRTNTNYFFNMVGGITINQFDKHRIVILVTYAKSLRPLIEIPPEKQYEIFFQEFVLPYSFKNVNTLTVKLMMAL